MSRVAFWRFLGGIFSQRCQSRDVISLSLSQFGTDANAAHSGSKRFLQASALEELKIRSARARRSIQTMPVPNARRESISRLFSLVSNTASFGLYHCTYSASDSRASRAACSRSISLSMVSRRCRFLVARSASASAAAARKAAASAFAASSSCSETSTGGPA